MRKGLIPDHVTLISRGNEGVCGPPPSLSSPKVKGQFFEGISQGPSFRERWVPYMFPPASLASSGGLKNKFVI